MIIETKNERIYLFDISPDGCGTKCENQIEYIKSKGTIEGAKKVLVIGAYWIWVGFQESLVLSDQMPQYWFSVRKTAAGRKTALQVGTLPLFEKEAHKAGFRREKY